MGPVQSRINQLKTKRSRWGWIGAFLGGTITLTFTGSLPMAAFLSVASYFCARNIVSHEIEKLENLRRIGGNNP